MGLTLIYMSSDINLVYSKAVIAVLAEMDCQFSATMEFDAPNTFSIEVLLTTFSNFPKLHLCPLVQTSLIDPLCQKKQTIYLNDSEMYPKKNNKY